MVIKTRPVGGVKKGHIMTKFSLQDEDGTSESGEIPIATKIYIKLDRSRKKR